MPPGPYHVNAKLVGDLENGVAVSMETIVDLTKPCPPEVLTKLKDAFDAGGRIVLSIDETWNGLPDRPAERMDFDSRNVVNFEDEARCATLIADESGDDWEWPYDSEKFDEVGKTPAYTTILDMGVFERVREFILNDVGRIHVQCVRNGFSPRLKMEVVWAMAGSAKYAEHTFGLRSKPLFEHTNLGDLSAHDLRSAFSSNEDVSSMVDYAHETFGMGEFIGAFGFLVSDDGSLVMLDVCGGSHTFVFADSLGARIMYAAVTALITAGPLAWAFTSASCPAMIARADFGLKMSTFAVGGAGSEDVENDGPTTCAVVTAIASSIGVASVDLSGLPSVKKRVEFTENFNTSVSLVTPLKHFGTSFDVRRSTFFEDKHHVIARRRVAAEARRAVPSFIEGLDEVQRYRCLRCRVATYATEEQAHLDWTLGHSVECGTYERVASMMEWSLNVGEPFNGFWPRCMVRATTLSVFARAGRPYHDPRFEDSAVLNMVIVDSQSVNAALALVFGEDLMRSGNVVARIRLN